MFTAEQVEAAVANALTQAEERWSARAREREQHLRGQVQDTVLAFAGEKARFFAQMDVEVVRLALAIAGRVLEREATLDAELVPKLVRQTLDRLAIESHVELRVAPEELSSWQEQSALQGAAFPYAVQPDATVAAGTCRVSTQAGKTLFGLQESLREIEAGMTDLLAVPAELKGEAEPRSGEAAKASWRPSAAGS